MKKKIFSILIAMAMTVSLAACGSTDNESDKSSESNSNVSESSSSDNSTSEDSSGSDIVVTDGSGESVQVPEVISIVTYDITTLAPWESASAGRLCVIQTLYDYLAYYDSTQECGMSGILMESYEKIDTYTSRVKIYDYITDSAGNHLTAEDVAFSFNTWKENGKSVKCALLDSVTVVDEYTVDIKLNADTIGDVENMMCGLVPIVTQAAYEASDDGMYAHVVSTAPYIVTEFVAGDHLTVVKNENYWQTDESLLAPCAVANVDTITFKIVTESAQVAINLETNSADMAALVPNTEISRFEADDNFLTYSTGSSNFTWLSFNVDPDNGLFYDNVALRQAICYAIDQEGLVNGAVDGHGTVSHAFANPICVDYNPDWDNELNYGYELETAKQLLADSGFDTSTPIRIMYSSGDKQKSDATIVMNYLRALGLENTEILGYEAALYQSYKTDPKEWDIIIDDVQSVDFVVGAASKFDRNVPAVNLAQDDKLQELFELVTTNAGHTTENIEEYMDYILMDQCYVYPLYRENYNYVAEQGVSSMYINFKGYLLPGACTYTEEFTR